MARRLRSQRQPSPPVPVVPAPANGKSIPDTKPNLLTRAYILGNGQVVDAATYASRILVNKPMQKAADVGSTQDADRDAASFTNKHKIDLVEPPYNPTILAKFFEADEVHYRACKTKVTDALLRGFEVVPANEKISPTDKAFQDDKAALLSFFQTCNRYDRFWGTLEQSALDREAVGWGAVEVIRSLDKRVAKVVHLPAEHLRVIAGWEGFAEERSDGKHMYYQAFGDKVVSRTRTKLNGEREPFSLELDGSWENAEWNPRNRMTFEPQESLMESANEIVYFPKHHPKTTYYGIPDIIPVVGYMLANLNIRDFLLQFFDHNTIPQYAVIINGADLSEEVKSLIATYFARDVKGQQHRTLIIPVPSQVAGEVTVTFQKLESDSGEGHVEIRKQNQQSIMMAHGVSPAILGLVDVASLGGGTGQSQLENYRERIVQPAQTEWAQFINSFIHSGLGLESVIVRFDPLSVEERSTVMRDMLTALQAGVVTINQVISALKLGQPISGGDRNFVLTPGGPMFIDQLAKPDSASVVDKLEVEIDKIRSEIDARNGGADE